MPEQMQKKQSNNHLFTLMSGNMYMDLLSDKLKKKLMKETDGVITEASPPSTTIAMPKAKAKAKAAATTTRPDGEKEAVMKLLDDLRKDPDKGITDAKTMCREAKKMNPKVTLADVEEFFLGDLISHIMEKRGSTPTLPTLPDSSITWILPTSPTP